MSVCYSLTVLRAAFCMQFLAWPLSTSVMPCFAASILIFNSLQTPMTTMSCGTEASPWVSSVVSHLLVMHVHILDHSLLWDASNCQWSRTWCIAAIVFLLCSIQCSRLIRCLFDGWFFPPVLRWNDSIASCESIHVFNHGTFVSTCDTLLLPINLLWPPCAPSRVYLSLTLMLVIHDTSVQYLQLLYMYIHTAYMLHCMLCNKHRSGKLLARSKMWGLAYSIEGSSVPTIWDWDCREPWPRWTTTYYVQHHEEEHMLPGPSVLVSKRSL